MARARLGPHTLESAAVACSVVLLSLSFPPVGFDFLAWIALAPLIAVVVTSRSGSAAYFFSALGGLVFFASWFSWIWAVPGFNLFDFIVLEVYFAQYFGVFGLVLNLAVRRVKLSTTLTAPVLWVALEYVRANFFFLALPMALLGHSQYGHLSLIQITSVTGVYGLSFLIVLANAALADSIIRLSRAANPSSPCRDRWRSAGAVAPVAAAIMTTGAALAYGAHVLAAEPAARLTTLGVLQRDLPPHVDPRPGVRAELLDSYIDLSRQVASTRPELIVWPETAIIGSLGNNPRLLARIIDTAQRTGSYLLVGSADIQKLAATGTPKRAIYNSAILVSPRGKLEGVYNKIRLVPFGEYEPLAGTITWPSWLVSSTGQLTPGSDHTVLRTSTARFGVVICWEGLFPELVRALVLNGAEFVVNITNESWFGTTAAREHLATISIFRAVEHGVALVRSANGGMSILIDPRGRIVARAHATDGRRAYDDGAFAVAVPAPGRPTFYTRHGDVAAYTCIGAAVVVVGLVVIGPHTAA